MKRTLIGRPLALLAAVSVTVVGYAVCVAGTATDRRLDAALTVVSETMRRHAENAGLVIHDPVTARLDEGPYVVIATVDSFDDAIIPDDFIGKDGEDVALVAVGGFESLPDGLYVLTYFIDPVAYRRHQQPTGVARLLGEGGVFFAPFSITDDPHPERGPRAGLTINADGVVDYKCYDGSGDCCDLFDLTGSTVH